MASKFNKRPFRELTSAFIFFYDVKIVIRSISRGCTKSSDGRNPDILRYTFIVNHLLNGKHLIIDIVGIIRVVMEWKSAYEWVSNVSKKTIQLEPIETEIKTLFEFAQMLRDGKLLCEILNILKPYCVEYIDDRDEFSCRQNIAKFLKACNEEFDINENQLFQVDDLFELSHFRKVLEVLSILSHRKEAMMLLQCSSFKVGRTRPRGATIEASTTEDDDEDEELKEQLMQSPCPNTLSALLTPVVFGVNFAFGRLLSHECDDVFDQAERFCSSQLYECLMHEGDDKDCQLVVKGKAKKHLDPIEEDITVETEAELMTEENPISPFVPDEEFFYERKATISFTKSEHIIRELFQTEQAYIAQLGKVVHTYIPKLKEHITEEEKRNIFLNIEEIHDLHLVFYKDLKSHLNATHELDFSPFVVHKTKLCSLYAHFCGNLEDSRAAISLLSKKNKAFRDKITSMNSLRATRLPGLSDYLSVCYQRVLRYPLILKRLKEAIEEYDQDDSSHVREAIRSMEDVGAYINAYKGDIKILHRMKEIERTLQSSTPFDIYKEYGRIVHNGLIEIKFSSGTKWERRFAFLFDHFLLLCETTGDTNLVKEKLPVKNLVVGTVQSMGDGSRKYSEVFMLIVEHSDIKSCMVRTKSAAEWMECIEKCVELVRDRICPICKYSTEENVLIKLTTFEKEQFENCTHCGNLMLGLISQGYRCGKCHIRVHKNCLKDSVL